VELLRYDLNHFAALVLATLSADAMRQGAFVAAGAFRGDGSGQVVVGAAGGGAALGVTSFRIRHLLVLLTA
jgi:hypothetical protein